MSAAKPCAFRKEVARTHSRLRDRPVKQLVGPEHDVKQPSAINVLQLFPNQQKFRRLCRALAQKVSDGFPAPSVAERLLAFRKPSITVIHEVVHAEKSQFHRAHRRLPGGAFIAPYDSPNHGKGIGIPVTIPGFYSTCFGSLSRPSRRTPNRPFSPPRALKAFFCCSGLPLYE